MLSFAGHFCVDRGAKPIAHVGNDPYFNILLGKNSGTSELPRHRGQGTRQQGVEFFHRQG